MPDLILSGEICHQKLSQVKKKRLLLIFVRHIFSKACVSCRIGIRICFFNVFLGMAACQPIGPMDIPVNRKGASLMTRKVLPGFLFYSMSPASGYRPVCRSVHQSQAPSSHPAESLPRASPVSFPGSGRGQSGNGPLDMAENTDAGLDPRGLEYVLRKGKLQPGCPASDTTTMALRFPLLKLLRRRDESSPASIISSGISTSSAPPAMPLSRAINPVFRPITSMKNSRSIDWAVSLTRSIASSAVLIAVSNPTL